MRSKCSSRSISATGAVNRVTKLLSVVIEFNMIALMRFLPLASTRAARLQSAINRPFARFVLLRAGHSE
jgi:hypothetical protein